MSEAESDDEEERKGPYSSGKEHCEKKASLPLFRASFFAFGRSNKAFPALKLRKVLEVVVGEMSLARVPGPAGWPKKKEMEDAGIDPATSCICVFEIS